MDSSSDTAKIMHEEQGRDIIKKLQGKIDTTRYNMEVSKEIIAVTPSDVQREKLTQKNIRRQHGIAGIENKISDIEQALEK